MRRSIASSLLCFAGCLICAEGVKPTMCGANNVGSRDMRPCLPFPIGESAHKLSFRLFAQIVSARLGRLCASVDHKLFQDVPTDIKSLPRSRGTIEVKLLFRLGLASQ